MKIWVWELMEWVTAVEGTTEHLKTKGGVWILNEFLKGTHIVDVA